MHILQLMGQLKLSVKPYNTLTAYRKQLSTKSAIFLLITLAFKGQTERPEVNRVSSSIHSDDRYKIKKQKLKALARKKINK